MARLLRQHAGGAAAASGAAAAQAASAQQQQQQQQAAPPLPPWLAQPPPGQQQPCTAGRRYSVPPFQGISAVPGGLWRASVSVPDAEGRSKPVYLLQDRDPAVAAAARDVAAHWRDLTAPPSRAGLMFRRPALLAARCAVAWPGLVRRGARAWFALHSKATGHKQAGSSPPPALPALPPLLA